MLNSASIINCSFLHMKEELDQLVAGGTPMFHIDLMDGHYVPNLCMPIKLIEELKMCIRDRYVGEVFMRQQAVYFKSPEQAIKSGLAFCSEDRKGEGIFPNMSVADNLTMPIMDLSLIHI